MQNLAHSASFESLDKDAPSKAGTKHLAYVPVTLHDGVAYVSGQLPKIDGEVRVFGKVGREVTLDAARKEARICVLQALACLKEALGDLSRLHRVLKVTGFVASAPGFNEQPKVIDAASELLAELLGESGRDARSAIGVAELPRDAAVEIEFVVTYAP
jgi:enamine deaminase RidA (YjgF/YER057c/UK114 family)